MLTPERVIQQWFQVGSQLYFLFTIIPFLLSVFSIMCKNHLSVEESHLYIKIHIWTELQHGHNKETCLSKSLLKTTSIFGTYN